MNDFNESQNNYYTWIRGGGYTLINNWSSASSEGQPKEYYERDAKTIFGVTDTLGGVCIAIAEKPGLIGSEMTQLMQNYGCQYAVALDGGNSTGCYYNGAEKYDLKREITDCILFYKPKPTPEPGGDPTGFKLNATNDKFVIRSTPVSGTIFATVTKGNSADILAFESGFKSDGWQWAKVRYGNTVGYSQIDTKNYYTISGWNSSKSLYLKANNNSFRVRATPVTGSSKVVVQQGQQARITEFLGFQSDGYQWVKVDFNGVIGYSQADTKSYYTFGF